MPSSGRDMLDRAALVHRWDCPAVAELALPEPDVAEVDAAAAAALRRPYDALRRLIGQAAGLLVLAQTSQRREILDLPAVAVAREQWREVTAALGDLSAPRNVMSVRSWLDEGATVAAGTDTVRPFTRSSPSGGWSRVARRTDPVTAPVDELSSLTPAFTCVGGRPAHDPDQLFES